MIVFSLFVQSLVAINVQQVQPVPRERPKGAESLRLAAPTGVAFVQVRRSRFLRENVGFGERGVLSLTLI
jgi:hypothetical protein